MGAHPAPRSFLRYAFSLTLSTAGCGLVLLAQQLPPARSLTPAAPLVLSAPVMRPAAALSARSGLRMMGQTRLGQDVPVVALGSAADGKLSAPEEASALVAASVGIGGPDEAPAPYDAASLALSPGSTPQRPEVTVYQVQPGDNLWLIAEHFGLTQDTVVWSNPDLEQNPDQLSIGQELYIMPVDGVLHTISRGETLAAIAQRYKVDTGTIINYPGNDITDPSQISVGEKLIIPGGTKPPPPASAPAAASASVAPGGAQLMIPAGAPAVPTDAPAMPGRFVWPAQGVITQGYYTYHGAIDIANNQGTPLHAADAGTVTWAAWSGGLGNAVQIDHGDGFATTYGHLYQIQVSVGQQVARGEQIGLMGTTGHSTGPHVHFIVTYNGGIVNPMDYLP